MRQDKGIGSLLPWLAHHDIGRANPLKRCNTNLMKVRSEVSKKEFPSQKFQLSACNLSSTLPAFQSNRSAWHMLKTDIGGLRRNRARVNGTCEAFCNIAKPSDPPSHRLILVIQRSRK